MQKYISSPYLSLDASSIDANGTPIQMAASESATIYLDYTLGGISPSTTLTVQVSPDGTNYYEIDSVTKTATGKHAVNFNNVNAEYVRVVQSGTAATVSTTASVVLGSNR